METELFAKGPLRKAMTAIELQAFEASIADTIKVPPRTEIIRRGERHETTYYIIHGAVGRYCENEKGDRHLTGISIAGDLVDFHGFALKYHDQAISSLDNVELARIPHSSIIEMIGRYPSFGDVLWRMACLDTATSREWIFRLQYLTGKQRLAHFISEIIERARLAGTYDGNHFPFRMFQHDFAQACGLSAVHTNRCFRSLCELNLICPSKPGDLRIVDENGLKRFGKFDGQYLNWAS